MGRNKTLPTPIKNQEKDLEPLATQYTDYTENNYGKVARLTNEDYRNDLTSWQIPAIKEHFGSLEGKNFIDIGAGDIVLGEKQNEIGRPEIFYVQDLSKTSIDAGINRMKCNGVDIKNIIPLISINFDFSQIENGSIDCAFSNSLFSHLSLNSILLCLRNLSVKMKKNSKYMTSMIVVTNHIEPDSYDWSYLRKKGTNVVSYSTKDPFHYTKETILQLSRFNSGFEVVKIHDYGHPFQKLVEFRAQ